MAKSIVGDQIGKRGIVYAPTNRAGVMFLFACLLDEFDMLVEEISPDSKYVVGRRRVSSEYPESAAGAEYWERVVISITYRSSETRNSSEPESDLLICWYHDWPECPLKTFELKALFENSSSAETKIETSFIKDKEDKLENSLTDITDDDSGELLQNRNITKQRFENAINKLDEKIKNNFSDTI